MTALAARPPDTRTATIVIAAHNSKDRGLAKYVCDGVNDAQIMNRAIGELPVAGGRIVLLDGDFILHDTIAIDKSYVTLQGQGFSTWLHVGSGADVPAVKIGHTTYPVFCTIVRDLVINGNKVGQTVPVPGIAIGVLGEWAGSTFLKDVTVTGAKLHGILVGVYTVVTMIQDCIVSDSDEVGIANFAWYTFVKRCVVEDNGLFGIYSEEQGTLVDSCYIEGNTSAGVYVVDTFAPVITNNVLANNFRSAGVNRAAIGLGGVSFGHIRGNTIGWQQAGYELDYAIVIFDATSTNNVVTANSYDGTVNADLLDQGTGTAKDLAFGVLNAIDTPVDGESLTYDVASGMFEWEPRHLSWMSYLRSGAYHSSQSCGEVTTWSSIADRLYVYPFYVPLRTTFDRISIHVTAEAAGSARLGVYADDGSIYPGDLVLDAGTVSVGTAGQKEIEISLMLEPGLYWLAFMSNVAPSLGAQTDTYCFAPLGSTGPYTKRRNHFYISYSFGALPDPFPAGANYVASHHAVMMRKA